MRRVNGAILAIGLVAAAIAPTTAPAGAASSPSSQFHAVSCTSATFCMAVGEYATSGGATLAERWNGKAWSVVASPNPASSTFSRLYGVSCTSPSNCIAVGSQYNATTKVAKTLVEHWNGKAWTRVPSANAGELGEGDLLVSVSCASATSCIAAGEYELGGVGRPATFVERWTGKSWKVIKSADPARSYSALEGVSC